ncbi:hypothetical protein EXS70_02135, partial [Candidatus Peribacteria bacterium]|nr:hypothetical protein [Candidatus Peribacteria bacterium]
KSERKDPEAFAQLQILIDVITAIRKLRSEQGIEPGKEVTVTIFSKDHTPLLDSQAEHIRRMTKTGSLTLSGKAEKLQNTVVAILSGAEVHLSLDGLIDKGAEVKKLKAEQAELERYLKGIESKLSDASFTEKAPAKVVESEKKKLEETREKMKKIEERLKSLS